MDVSGAASMNLNGKAETLVAELSGACKLAAEDFLANDVRIELSGASKASVLVADSIDIEASGASNLSYRTLENRSVNVNLHEVSKSSSVRKIN